MRTRRVPILFALAVFVALGAAGCTNAGWLNDPTPVQTWKITPSARGAATKPPSVPSPTATSIATATSPATAASAPGAMPAAATAATAVAPNGVTGTGTKLVVIGQNLVFDKTTLSAPAGPIAVEFDNRDAGQPHNFHIYKGSDVSGEDKGSTPLNVGPATDTLNVTLDKGEYYYQCDVHPSTMAGKLTVS